MSITTRSEYGLRALVVLAEQLGDERTSASELARREAIPLKYLEQILAELKKSGVVRSHAGARGGYQLARPAREITVGEVIQVLDGSQAPLGCTGPTGDGTRARGSLQVLWQRLHRAMSGVLDNTTLEQLTFRPTLELESPSGTVKPAEATAESASTDGVYQI